MSVAHGIYDLGVRALHLMSPLASFGTSKVAEGIRGRRLTRETLTEWAASQRDPERPLVWFHAPSVGEGLQARAVMEALLARHPDLQLVHTFFSPSAVPLARKLPVQAAGYLPWDTRREVGPLLDALRPGLVAFTKTEVWPGVVRASEARGVPSVLVAATLPADAGRMGFLSRTFLAPAFRSLRAVLAIAPEDAERFGRLGALPERIQVTGDPGVDSAWQRAQIGDPAMAVLTPFRANPAPTLVAGSTWGPDEEVLLPAFVRLRERHPGVRLILAPHETDDEHLDGVEVRLRGAGLTWRRLARVEAGGAPTGADVILVDRVGALAALYTVGVCAWVGGGFHRHGLHSVLEPAAAGIPILHGPRYSNSRAAADLLAEGGSRVITTSDEALEGLHAWFGQAEARKDAGARARGYIERHRGASERTALALEPFLGG